MKLRYPQLKIEIFATMKPELFRIYYINSETKNLQDPKQNVLTQEGNVGSFTTRNSMTCIIPPNLDCLR